MSSQVMSCHVMSCHVMSCHVMSCHVMSCRVMSYHVNRVLSRHVMQCYVASCPVALRRAMSRRAATTHLHSYLTLTLRTLLTLTQLMFIPRAFAQLHTTHTHAPVLPAIDSDFVCPPTSASDVGLSGPIIYGYHMISSISRGSKWIE